MKQASACMLCTDEVYRHDPYPLLHPLLPLTRRHGFVKRTKDCSLDSKHLPGPFVMDNVIIADTMIAPKTF